MTKLSTEPVPNLRLPCFQPITAHTGVYDNSRVIATIEIGSLRQKVGPERRDLLRHDRFCASKTWPGATRFLTSEA